mgnify:CR=1 FL=1
MPWGPNNVGDANNAPNPIEKNMSQSDVKKYYNRADAVRRDTDKQKNILTNVYTSLDNRIKADYYIYIQCDPLVAFHRLQRRGRECENKITLQYITKLHNEYEIFAKSIIQKFGQDKIIFLNGNQQPREIIEELVKFIRDKTRI